MVALEANGASWKAPPPVHARKWLDEAIAPVAGSRAVVVRSNRDGTPGFWVIDPGSAAPPRKLPLGDLQPVLPAVSNDGVWVAFSAVDRGIFVAPLDGSAPPRQVTTDPRHNVPRFSRDDRKLVFEVQLADGATEIASVPVEGGAIERIAGPGSGLPSASPKRDEIAFTRTEKGSGSIVLMDLATKRTRVLVPNVVPNLGGWFSADGARYVTYTDLEAFEIDVATGRQLHRLQAGADSLTGVAYGGGGVLLTRSIWSGDLWTAKIALP
jgi:Tol biopolymer transport system component